MQVDLLFACVVRGCLCISLYVGAHCAHHHVQTPSSECVSVYCAGQRVHHSLQLVDNQLTERQALTLDYSHAEEAALGLAARANMALTGWGLSHPLCTHTQAGLRGTIRRTGRHTTAHLSARLATCVGCKLTRVPQPGRQEIRGRHKSP